MMTQRSPDRKLDVRLYAIVDPDRAGGRELSDLASLVAGGGATLVQLRDKHSETRAMVEAARAIRAKLTPLRVPLLINDRVDVALAVGADGVHLGQEDMAIADARRLLPGDSVIGLSVKTVAQAEAAPIDLINYAAIGGIFTTTSKNNPDPPIGIEGLRAIAQVFRRRSPGLPLCAIAGIDATNASAVIAAGVDGVALISAISLAPSPENAARELRAIIDTALAAKARS
jgi:thiamine-phosphate pyrophosphorylase